MGQGLVVVVGGLSRLATTVDSGVGQTMPTSLLCRAEHSSPLTVWGLGNDSQPVTLGFFCLLLGNYLPYVMVEGLVAAACKGRQGDRTGGEGGDG